MQTAIYAAKMKTWLWICWGFFIFGNEQKLPQEWSEGEFSREYRDSGEVNEAEGSVVNNCPFVKRAFKADL